MELYFSVDIETNGPIPGEFSMLSLGAACFELDEYGNGKVVAAWSQNMETLPGAKEDESTMEWWKTQPAAWEIVQQNKKDPKQSMEEFASWVESICKERNAEPVFVAYPAGYDWTFVYWYLIKFAGRSPFSFSSLDIKSIAMYKMGCSFRKTRKKDFPKKWLIHENRAPHVALEDAIEQGWIFVEMMKDR